MAKITKKKEFMGGAMRLALGFAVVGIAVALPTVAEAKDLKEVLDSVTDNLQSAVPLIQLIAYIAGAFLAVTGLIKLKTAVENPQAGGVGPGIVRLILGALLIGLPSVITIVLDTTGTEADTTEATDAWGFN